MKSHLSYSSKKLKALTWNALLKLLLSEAHQKLCAWEHLHFASDECLLSVGN